MCLNRNTLVLIELSHEDHVMKSCIPGRPSEINLFRLSTNPSSRHIILTSFQGYEWYFYGFGRSWKGFKTSKPSRGTRLRPSELSLHIDEGDSHQSGGWVHMRLPEVQRAIPSSISDVSFTLLGRQESGSSTHHRPYPKSMLVLVTTSTSIYRFSEPVHLKPDGNGRIFLSDFIRDGDGTPGTFCSFFCSVPSTHAHRLYLRDT